MYEFYIMVCFMTAYKIWYFCKGCLYGCFDEFIVVEAFLNLHHVDLLTLCFIYLYF
jgi:hypothetical protein